MAADLSGSRIEISHLAIGDSGHIPSTATTALSNERDRAELAGAQDISVPDGDEVSLSALFNSTNEYWVREFGAFLSDGTLFAIWSHPSTALLYKSNTVDTLLSFNLKLTSVPTGSVTVNPAVPDLNLGFAGPLAETAAGIVANNLRILHLQGHLP